MKPIPLLRLEGLAVLVVSTLAYHQMEYSWWMYAGLFLAPDLSMLGYLANRRVGAAVYNLGHTYWIPVLLGLLCWWLQALPGVGIALIWTAHIGIDRLLGYGLKYETGFQFTHLRERPCRRP